MLLSNEWKIYIIGEYTYFKIWCWFSIYLKMCICVYFWFIYLFVTYKFGLWCTFLYFFVSIDLYIYSFIYFLSMKFVYLAWKHGHIYCMFSMYFSYFNECHEFIFPKGMVALIRENIMGKIRVQKSTLKIMHENVKFYRKITQALICSQ